MIIGAKWIVQKAGKLLRDGAVYISDGRIARVGNKDKICIEFPHASKIDLGDCLIAPGFVNFHAHLELEFCRGKVKYNGNFVDWLQAIRDLKHDFLTLPGYFPEESVRETLSAGVTTLIDHYTMQLDFESIFAMGLRYFGLRELFEFNNHHPNKDRLRESTIYSLAPHSPYTASAEMAKVAFELAVEMNRPLSTHLSEMKEEIEFLAKGNESIEKLLMRAGAFDENWRPPGVSPTRYFYDLGILSPMTYCVHLNYIFPGDVELLKSAGITHIFCPRSHSYFRHPEHPLMTYQKSGIKSCLGTDSYGSNSDLRILGEAEEVWKKFPELSAERVFEMITTAGLTPLGLEGLIGEVSLGCYADLSIWKNPEGENFDEIMRWLVKQKTTLLTMREGRIVHAA